MRSRFGSRISIFRGGFGYAFKRVVCVIKGKACDECLLKQKCIYSYIFETPPQDTEMLRLYPKVPHPFVIESPGTENEPLNPPKNYPSIWSSLGRPLITCLILSTPLPTRQLNSQSLVPVNKQGVETHDRIKHQATSLGIPPPYEGGDFAGSAQPNVNGGENRMQYCCIIAKLCAIGGRRVPYG